MRSKLIIGFILFCLIQPVVGFSNHTDSILKVSIGNKFLASNSGDRSQLIPMDYPFFDTESTQISLSFELQRSNNRDTMPFVFLEIKKKSLQQFRLRPVISKKVRLYTENYYIDSLPLPDSLFSSGNFDLIVSYMNDSLKVLDVKKVAFQLLRSKNHVIKEEFYQISADSTSNHIHIEKTFVDKYEIVQLKKNILSLTPLVKGSEAKVIKELGLVDDLQILKRYFYNFWYNRNPAEPEKAWADYVLILNEVAKRFGNTNTPGYESDRGRIYIQYGVPDKLERVVNEKGALPYEIWFYYRSGKKNNIKFLFFQPGMLGNEMLLLQTNLPEEGINSYWKDILLEDPNNSANKLKHRVFEYFN